MKSSPSSRWRTAAAVALAALVPLLVFSRGLRGIFFQADLVVYYLPAYTYATRVLRTGVLPLWAPELEGGQPFHAQWEPTLLYPVDVPFRFLLSPWWALNASLLFHYALGAVGMFAYARRLALSRPASLVSAAVYAVNGFMIAHLEHPNLIVGAAWLPWLLLTVERGLHGRPLAGALGMGLTIGVMLLGGHPDLFLMGALVVGLLVLLHPTGGILRKRTAREALAPLMMLFGGYGLGLTLAAAQILPTLELARLSWERHAASSGFQDTWSLRPAQFLVQVLPDVFGRNGQDTYWGMAHYWEECSYVGALALSLAVVGLFSRHRLARFYGGLAVLAAWLSMGTNSVAFSILRLLPAFGTMRLPCRYMFLFDLSVAVLAGMGAHWLSHLTRPAERARARRLYGLIAAALSLAAVWIASLWFSRVQLLAGVGRRLHEMHLVHTRDPGPLLHRYQAQLGVDVALLLGGLTAAFLLLRLASSQSGLRRAVSPLAFAGITATLILFGSGYHTVIPARWIAEPPFTASAIRAEPAGEPFRILQWDSLKVHSFVAVHRGAWPHTKSEYRQYIAALPGNYNLVWGLSSVRQEEWSALPLRHTRQLVSGILARGERNFGAMEPYLRWLNTGYVISQRPLTDPALTPLAADRIHLYRCRDRGQRAWVVRRATIETDERRLLRRLSSDPQGLTESVALSADGSAADDAVVPGLNFRSVQDETDLRGYGHLDSPSQSMGRGVPGSAAYVLDHARPAQRFSRLARVPAPERAGTPALPGGVPTPGSVPGSAPGSEPARILERSPTRVVLAACAAREGYLVLGETWVSGWRAWVDGREAPVLRANIIHRAVKLPAGQHQVEFRYLPAAFRLGLYGTAAGLAVLLGMTAARWGRSA